MNGLVQTKEDRDALEKKHGVHIDNVSLVIKKDGYDMGLNCGVSVKEGKFLVFAGADFDHAIIGEGSNYSEAVADLLGKL